MSDDDRRATDIAELRVLVARFEERLSGVRQTIEGVKLLAEQLHYVQTAQERITDRLADLEGDLERVDRDIRAYVAAVERRREQALVEAEARQEVAVKRVEESCAALGARLDSTAVARISGRATITAAAIAGGGGLVTLLIARLFEVLA